MRTAVFPKQMVNFGSRFLRIFKSQWIWVHEETRPHSSHVV